MLSLKMALRSIGANKLRAALTMLGIIIGVMALVVLVSLVNGATASVTDAVSGLGTNMLTVTIEDDQGFPLTLQEVDGWNTREDLGKVAPYLSDELPAFADGETGEAVVYGTTPALFEIQGLQLAMGRFLKNADIASHTYVCVINEAAAKTLIGYTDCVDQTILLDGVEHTIVGVLSANEENLTSSMADSMAAYVPYTTLLRLSDSLQPDVTAFCVSAPKETSMQQLEQTVTGLLLERFEYEDDAFTVTSQNVLEDTLGAITSILTILLGGIAAISLLVGGIGIMNIMLVTVTERTREIGIRKAIGASRGTILTQFLMEAVVLCMIGCGLGIFLSWAILQTVTTVVASLNMAFTLDAGVVLIAVVFCFMIGVVFGLYPANKAAKMKPIDALHDGG